MNKKTSSLPGPSYSHFKAAQFDSLASQVHSNLNPLKTGYPPQGWRNEVLVMIPKKKFYLRPEKL